MCMFLIVTFKFDESSFNWMWAEQIQVPILLGILSIVLGVFWIIENRKLKDKLMNR